MKFLEYTPFNDINVFLEKLDLGNCTIRGNLEALSCKQTGNDQRISTSLELQILDSIDYDFSAVKAHLFFKEEEWESFKQMIDTYLTEACRKWAAANEGTSLLESMTSVIDEVIKISESDIYSYNPNSDEDPLLEKGALWSINVFFYNRKRKRVVSFRCSCTSNLSGDDFLTAALSDDEDEDALIDMDI